MCDLQDSCLNCIHPTPPRPQNHPWRSSTSEGDLTWRQGHCRGDQVQRRPLRGRCFRTGALASGDTRLILHLPPRPRGSYQCSPRQDNKGRAETRDPAEAPSFHSDVISGGRRTRPVRKASSRVAGLVTWTTGWIFPDSPRA